MSMSILRESIYDLLEHFGYLLDEHNTQVAVRQEDWTPAEQFIEDRSVEKRMDMVEKIARTKITSYSFAAILYNVNGSAFFDSVLIGIGYNTAKEAHSEAEHFIQFHGLNPNMFRILVEWVPLTRGQFRYEHIREHNQIVLPTLPSITTILEKEYESLDDLQQRILLRFGVVLSFGTLDEAEKHPTSWLLDKIINNLQLPNELRDRGL